MILFSAIHRYIEYIVFVVVVALFVCLFWLHQYYYSRQPVCSSNRGWLPSLYFLRISSTSYWYCSFQSYNQQQSSSLTFLLHSLHWLIVGVHFLNYRVMYVLRLIVRELFWQYIQYKTYWLVSHSELLNSKNQKKRKKKDAAHFDRL